MCRFRAQNGTFRNAKRQALISDKPPGGMGLIAICPVVEAFFALFLQKVCEKFGDFDKSPYLCTAIKR